MGRGPHEAGGADTARDVPDDRRTRRYLVWVALLVVALLPFVFIEGPGSGVLESLGLIDRNESFSELWFPDRAALPTVVSAGAPLGFDFSLRNREGASTTYRWQVRLGPVGSGSADVSSTVPDSVVIARGRLRLAPGEARTVHVAEPASVVPGSTAVSVVLGGRPEAIHFPLTITPPGPVAAPG